MKELILKILRRTDSSLKANHKDAGWSGRKLTAVIVVTMATIVGHILYYRYATKHDNWTLYPEILLIDYFMAAACLGLVAWSEWQKIKSGKNDVPNEAKPENTGTANP